ncbi:hypothetical protein DERP_014129 [Dermatophagoides pteronyssinus]|uniref:Uncharacterized protein n=1 Tax=Dermatophagoides pteronyssinus TaxID=6956 RepID=A0ABQ8IXY1_DERPT|nr:hypothetical protein DERP_014129 [Dermatophagoides pteronyssinus]
MLTPFFLQKIKSTTLSLLSDFFFTWKKIVKWKITIRTRMNESLKQNTGLNSLKCNLKKQPQANYWQQILVQY